MENLLEQIENTDQAYEISIKLNAVIDRLIDKEGILIVINSASEKMERVLSLNVNYDSPVFQ